MRSHHSAPAGVSRTEQTPRNYDLASTAATSLDAPRVVSRNRAGARTARAAAALLCLLASGCALARPETAGALFVLGLLVGTFAGLLVGGSLGFAEGRATTLEALREPLKALRAHVRQLRLWVRINPELPIADPAVFQRLEAMDGQLRDAWPPASASSSSSSPPSAGATGVAYSAESRQVAPRPPAPVTWELASLAFRPASLR